MSMFAIKAGLAIRCDNCGNTDQNLMPFATEKVMLKHGGSVTRVIGIKCEKCGHIERKPE